jgi:hypothetical protein
VTLALLVSIVLQLAGLAAQLAGVLLMANGYTSLVTIRHVPRLLASALRRGNAARGAAELHHLTVEDKLRSLQGLALIGLGFLLQTAGTALPLLALR